MKVPATPVPFAGPIGRQAILVDVSGFPLSKDWIFR
jgi:hypothetical protein